MFAFQVKSMLMWKVQYKALWEGKGEKSIFPLLVLFLNRIFRSVGFFFFSQEINDASEKDFVCPSFWDI